MNVYDVIIIGAGITGSFLAHDLSKYQLKIAVLEKECDVANGATMANSAIIHSGHDPKEGTLKARLNVRGNQMYESICQELGVEFQRTSAFVVATSKEECQTLEQLFLQAERRQVPAIMLTRDQAVEKEPNLSENVIEAMELPTTGIIYPWEVAIALMEEAMENQVELFLNQEVKAIKKDDGFFSVTAESCNHTNSFAARYIINAAGVYSDKIYGMVSPNQKEAFSITPRRGEYFVLDKQKVPLVTRVIYPVPSAVGKGVLVVPTVHNNVLLGPNSLFIEDKEGNNTTQGALEYVRKEVKKTVQNIPFDQVIRSFSGLRPTGNREDFIIEEAKDVAGFINVACIESPGLASAPAISEYVLEEILKKQSPKLLSFQEKPEYKKRRPWINLHKMSVEERDLLVKRQPEFGRVICRCEQITEGEIVDVIHRMAGATTVKAIKKRVRPGMGRCQGGFCEPKVVDILARELNISPLEVRMDGVNSTMLLETTKGGGLL